MVIIIFTNLFAWCFISILAEYQINLMVYLTCTSQSDSIMNMLHVHVHVTPEHVNMLVYLNKNALL